MKTLVTGATGFIGNALCSELAARRFPVVGAVRGMPVNRRPGVDYRITGDLGTLTDCARR